ncbi:invasion associated locus B family protein [Rhizobium jaguaris]|uniref:Uncharacterized protein n=1 Tax=Rhizobium jaguaris TaxID=1312183 RepID=A0A387G1T0_9HYPH|nr:invasion associated locus B family protein [Rhizobium jaguaris]AYG63777.1 hypothetical protein CCGE525_28560 [Rhizobium jaguaris]
MFAKKLPTALALVLLGFSTAYAEPPARIGQFDAWGAYSYRSGSEVSCYVLSTPTSQVPSTVDHGSNFFIVARGPDGKAYMPEVAMGYDLKQGAPIQATIGDATFTMFAKDRHGWVEDQSQEPTMVDAMKSGNELSVQATSRRGTATSYSYSLSGITAALKQIKVCE